MCIPDMAKTRKKIFLRLSGCYVREGKMVWGGRLASSGDLRIQPMEFIPYCREFIPRREEVRNRP